MYMNSDWKASAFSLCFSCAFLQQSLNPVSLEFKCHSSVYFFPETKLRNSQPKQMKRGFNPQFSEMKAARH